MYAVSIFNGATETVIHYPSADKNTPHLLTIPFKEILSQPDQLAFTMLSNNPGYNLVTGLTTRVKVTDTRDNSIVFSGRVIPTQSNMANGEFTKDVACEGALAYLNDTHTRRWKLTNQTPAQVLTYLLNQHNAKVDATRKIYLGTVTVTQPITIDTNYETTLGAIVSKVHNVLGGDIRVRETAGILYLDCLTAIGANNGTVIKLGYNMRDLIEEWDPSEIITRLIPLGYGEGINQLGISVVNGGIEYLDNAASIATYGVIEGVVTNKDIQDAATLKVYGNTVLGQKNQPRLTISTSSLDLSVLAGHEGEKYGNGDTLEIINSVMGIDVLARVIERSVNLLAPWDPALVISTRPIRLSDQIIALKQKNQSLENAPQGNTCIYSQNAQENADAGNPIRLDLDIPAETININRVYINLHGRKYRAYEKGLAAGGGSTATSSSGGGTTSSSGGDHKHKMLAYGADVTSGHGIIVASWLEYEGSAADGSNFPLVWSMDDAFPGAKSDIYTYASSGNHAHTVGNHTHDLTINSHQHAIDYGIFESTYPKNSKIKVNGVDIGLNFGDGLTPFDQYNLDITPHISIGNNKIEISTEQNGRIEAIIYSQIFIQSK